MVTDSESLSGIQAEEEMGVIEGSPVLEPGIL